MEKILILHQQMDALLSACKYLQSIINSADVSQTLLIPQNAHASLKRLIDSIEICINDQKNKIKETHESQLCKVVQSAYLIITPHKSTILQIYKRYDLTFPPETASYFKETPNNNLLPSSSSILLNNRSPRSNTHNNVLHVLGISGTTIGFVLPPLIVANAATGVIIGAALSIIVAAYLLVMLRKFLTKPHDSKKEVYDYESPKIK